MSGEELKKRLKETGISQAEIARRLGVIPQSVIQTLEAKDIKTGFLEDLCRVLDKDMSFFYNIPDRPKSSDTLDDEKDNKIRKLQQEVDSLREELRRREDPEQPKKESEVYRLWMEHMRITEKMQELYQNHKEG